MTKPSIFETTPSRRPRKSPPNPQARHCGFSEHELSTFLLEHCDVLEPIVSLLADRPQLLNRTFAEALGRLLRASENPLKSAFLSRSCNAIARMAAVLPAETMGEAVGEASDYHVLLHALEEPETLRALEENDPLAAARVHGLEVRAHLLKEEGGVLSVNEVAARLGISRQAIDKRRRARQLLALPLGKNRYVYPAWQFTNNGTLPGLERILEAFQDEAPWSQAAFFLGENTVLDGKRPLDELRLGNIDGVRRAAALLGEHIAA